MRNIKILKRKNRVFYINIFFSLGLSDLITVNPVGIQFILVNLVTKLFQVFVKKLLSVQKIIHLRQQGSISTEKFMRII